MWSLTDHVASILFISGTTILIINIAIVIHMLSTVRVWEGWTIGSYYFPPALHKIPKCLLHRLMGSLLKDINVVVLFFPPHLQDVDKWSFDVFALNEASGEHSLKFMMYELLTRYDLLSRFKVRNLATSIWQIINTRRPGYVWNVFFFCCTMQCKMSTSMANWTL